MTFIASLEKELNTTQTANGAKAYKSTGDKCLDLFGSIAACRSNLSQATKLFAKAYKENPETALRILFWARDIRGGQGERNVFRNILKYVADGEPELVNKIIPLVPFYGRWDDLFVLENTSSWGTVLELIKEQLLVDLSFVETGNVSLLGKWMPSINTSSKDSKRLGRIFAAYLGWSERSYRKNLNVLREKIKIVEQKMCSKEWSQIDYSKLPSRASFMYRKAFAKNDNDRYSAYLKAVAEGKAKINAGTLYPYDIVEQYLYKGARNDTTIDLQWNALPNYMEKPLNGLVVADTSGSMSGRPMAVSVSLALYIAERNPSKYWKDKFITFSEKPELQDIVGNTIGQKVYNLSRASWGYNTNLMAVFNLILSAAVKNSVPPEDMPEKLIIVSDMQFDVACKSNKRTNFEQVQKVYRNAGYKLPEIVFWNVNAYANNPMEVDDTGTCLVSGCSPSILKSILTDKILTPLDVMHDTVYTERYDALKVAFE